MRLPRARPLWIGAFLLAGCAMNEPPPDAPACTASVYENSFQIAAPEQLDLLFVVDDSPSMQSARAIVEARLVELVRVLTVGDATPDRPNSGDEFRPTPDQRVGVITTSLSPPCDTAVSSVRVAPEFLAETPGAAERTQDGLRAILRSLPVGCAIEQPLDAAVRAAAGFARPNSMLFVVLVTNEDDCSLAPSVASAPHAPDGAPCPTAGRIELAELVRGLRSLRAERLSSLAFVVIAGVPQDSPFVVRDAAHPTGGEGTANLDGLLAEPQMREVSERDANGEPRLRAACETPNGLRAQPARRLVEAARAIAADGQVSSVVQSFCAPDWTAVFDIAVRHIPFDGAPSCMGRPLQRDAGGRVQCTIELRLAPPNMGAPFECSRVRGVATVPLRIEGGHEVCRVVQLPVLSHVTPIGDGFYFDDFSEDARQRCAARGQAGMLKFTFDPPASSTVTVHCELTRARFSDASCE